MQIKEHLVECLCLCVCFLQPLSSVESFVIFFARLQFFKCTYFLFLLFVSEHFSASLVLFSLLLFFLFVSFFDASFSSAFSISSVDFELIVRSASGESPKRTSINGQVPSIFFLAFRRLLFGFLQLPVGFPWDSFSIFQF